MRLVVIGDLHGCLDELRELLACLSLASSDLVTCVGDFVTKGPKTVECLELWRDEGWPAVLGNNDLEVLRIIRGEPGTRKRDLVDDARKIERRADLADYLESLPVLLDVGEAGTAVVHGGLLPDDRMNVETAVALTLRDVVRKDGGWRPAGAGDPRGERRFWADVWSGPRFVVYGHTPRPEVATHSNALGIDTGCVYGWSLTAAVRSDEGRWSTKSVPARRAWAER